MGVVAMRDVGIPGADQYAILIIGVIQRKIIVFIGNLVAAVTNIARDEIAGSAQAGIAQLQDDLGKIAVLEARVVVINIGQIVAHTANAAAIAGVEIVLGGAGVVVTI